MTDANVHNAFIERALSLASQHSAEGSHGPFGAVIVHNGAIIAEGINCVVADCDPTAHAEIHAIRAAAQALGRHALADCTLYASCKPCPMCLAAIYWARIPRVYYAASSDDARYAGFDDGAIAEYLCHDNAIGGPTLTQINHPDANVALQQWVNNPHRQPY